MRTLFPVALAASVLALAGAPLTTRAQLEPAPSDVITPSPPEAAAPEDEIVVAPPAIGVLVIDELELRPSLQYRARGELRVDPWIGAADLYFVTMRTRLGLDARWRDVRVFVQAQDARDFGAVDPTQATGATTDLHQGFAQLGGDDLFLRVGRQEIDWGSQRFVGALNWSSAARSFDAVRGRARHEALTVDAFGAWVRASRALSDPRGPSTAQTEGDWLAGISATLALDPLALVTAYALYRHDGPTELPITITDPVQMSAYLDRQRDIVSPGVRLESDGSGTLRYELELVAQLGRVMDREHVALGAAAEVHHRFVDVPLAPSVGGGASYGSGTSGGLSELDNFYPTNHARYGSADQLGLRNQIHGFVRAGIAPPGTNVEAWADVHVLALAEPGARWSDAIGRTIAHDPTNDERFLGTEVDVELRWRPDPHAGLWAGYAVLAPGAGAARLGRGFVTHWAYVMLDVTLP